MKEDSINSVTLTDEEDMISTQTTDTISVRSIGIDDWTVECFNLGELVSNMLPRVVRLAEKKPDSVPKKLEPYLNCPLLLHSASRKTVVKCRVLEKKCDGKHAYVGPTLIIPENYDGKIFSAKLQYYTKLFFVFVFIYMCSIYILLKFPGIYLSYSYILYYDSYN